MARVVNRYWKQSLNYRFLFRFSIVFKKDHFVFGKKRSFLKATHSFWTFKKRQTFVLENDRFLKNDLLPFFIWLFFLNDRFWKIDCLKKIFLTIMLTIVNKRSSLMIVNKGVTLTIVNEITKFIKTVVFGKTIVFKKLHVTLLNVVLHEAKKFVGSYTFLIFS